MVSTAKEASHRVVPLLIVSNPAEKVSIQHPHQPQGEFLAYGVFYAVGQDKTTYPKKQKKYGKSFSVISDFV